MIKKLSDIKAIDDIGRTNWVSKEYGAMENCSGYVV